MTDQVWPDLSVEYALYAAGYRRIAGLDEAGRGAWAGPVCAAAVVLPLSRPDLALALTGVRDSKLLAPEQREGLLPTILEVAEAVSTGWASPLEVDKLGIVTATRLAFARAVAGLRCQVDALLLDYLTLPEVDLPQQAIPKADLRCLSVAAASIVAKVERDRLMRKLEADFPGYGFARHKGYGTPQHRQALERLGPSPVHRMSWSAVRACVSGAGLSHQGEDHQAL
ncbi:MAG: ribonuclease HII [Anaerolineae bacterium]|nr:ribonuclease HII [Anaerolineae bacterium]